MLAKMVRFSNTTVKISEENIEQDGIWEPVNRFGISETSVQRFDSLYCFLTACMGLEQIS
jgi:hypothetical protein